MALMTGSCDRCGMHAERLHLTWEDIHGGSMCDHCRSAPQRYGDRFKC